MNRLVLPAGWMVYETSLQEQGGALYALVKAPDGEKSLFVQGKEPLPIIGESLSEGYLYPLTEETARMLRDRFPWLSPKRIPATQPSFGFGDRLGLATPGHIRAVRDTNVFPILAQQSVRENARTGRNFAEVLARAVFGVFQEGYKDGFGADADHLKKIGDAMEAAALGYTFFTCDPSDHVVTVENLPEDEVLRRFAELPKAEEWKQEYLGRAFGIPGLGELRFTTEALAKAAVKYGEAVEFATTMYRSLAERLPAGFDYEVSVDETESPTSALEHLFIARELHRAGVNLTSLAPRFVGEMEKGVDWRGDLDEFKQELRAHVVIAKSFGDYRLSLHSGSDKFTLYPVFAEETAGHWHVKTAGTSYLVALEVAARRDPTLFRKIAQLSLEHFAEDRATYHLSADPTRIPPLDTIADSELPELVSTHDSRQVFHVGFGSVLKSPFGQELKQLLQRYEEDYFKGLTDHLGQHLKELGTTVDA